MAIEWYYIKDDQKIGPLTDLELKAAASSGDLSPTDLVWKTGATEWVPASRAKGLFPQPKAKQRQPVPQTSAVVQNQAPVAGVRSTAKPNTGTNTSAISSLLSAAKSATQLAAKQAEKTKQTTITLPALYQPLGKHCFESQQHRAEFPDLFQKLNSVQKQLSALAKPQEGKPAPQSLGDKAKSSVGRVMEVVQFQKLSMQQSSLFGALGKGVYEAYGEGSGPSNLTAPIAASLSRLDELDADVSRLSSEGKGSWITPQQLAIAGGRGCCLPTCADCDWQSREKQFPSNSTNGCCFHLFRSAQEAAQRTSDSKHSRVDLRPIYNPKTTPENCRSNR